MDLRIFLRVRTVIGTNSIALAAIAALIVVALFWGMAALIAVITDGAGAVLLVPLVIGLIVGPLFFHAHARQLVAAICKLFRKEPLSWFWFPPKLFWNEALVDVLTTFGAACFVFLAYMMPRSLILNDFDWDIPLREAEEDFLTFAWIVLMAYIHQVRYLVLQQWKKQRRQNIKRVNKTVLPRAKRPVKPVDDTDKEFNEFRWKQRETGSPPQPPKTVIDDELEELRRKLEE